MTEVLYWTPNQNVRVLYDSSHVGGRYRVQNLIYYRLGAHNETYKRWGDATSFDSLPEAVHRAEQMDDAPVYRSVDEMPPEDDEQEFMP